MTSPKFCLFKIGSNWFASGFRLFDHLGDQLVLWHYLPCWCFEMLLQSFLVMVMMVYFVKCINPTWSKASTHDVAFPLVQCRNNVFRLARLLHINLAFNEGHQCQLPLLSSNQRKWLEKSALAFYFGFEVFLGRLCPCWYRTHFTLENGTTFLLVSTSILTATIPLVLRLMHRFYINTSQTYVRSMSEINHSFYSCL